MEIAHSPSGVLRLIAKVVLLGLLVVLLAKAILALLGLALLGLVACLCARALYLHRTSLGRIVFWTEARLTRSMTAVFRLLRNIVGSVGWLFLCPVFVILTLSRFAAWTVKKSAWLLYALLVGALWAGTAFCALVAHVAHKSMRPFANGLRCSGRAVATCVRLPLRVGVSLTHAVSAAAVRIGNLSGFICGTLLEVASGALVGTILLNLKGIQGLLFLPQIQELGPRIAAAALFGAFLGITLGLSRITRAKESEATVDPS